MSYLQDKVPLFFYPVDAMQFCAKLLMQAKNKQTKSTSGGCEVTGHKLTRQGGGVTSVEHVFVGLKAPGGLPGWVHGQDSSLPWVVKEECGSPFPKMVLRAKSFNTCRCQDHGLQQVRQRDDAPHHVSPVHQDQPMDLGKMRML